jgi:hypothetical protein
MTASAKRRYDLPYIDGDDPLFANGRYTPESGHFVAAQYRSLWADAVEKGF